MSKKKYNLNTIYISERLQENLKPISQSAFTAVTAPMGYGKTTAISWYLDKQSKNGNSCVIRISIYSDNLSVFWQSVQKAFAFAGLDFLDNYSCPSDAASAGMLADELCYSLSGQTSYYIFIDDFHLLTDGRVADFLCLLANRMTSNVHLIAASRDRFLSGGAVVRLGRKLHQLSADDLRLNHTELAVYAHRCGTELSDEQIESLLYSSEGWFSAVYLNLRTLSERGSLPDRDSDIYSMFIAAMIDPLPKKQRELLAVMGLADEFTAEMARFVTDNGDAQELLDLLTAQNAFVKCLPDGVTYRFHHMMKQCAERTFLLLPKQKKELYWHRFGSWYESRRQYLHAMSSYRKCGDFDALLRVVRKDAGILLSSLDPQRVLSGIEDCPVDVLKAHPLSILVLMRSMFNWRRIPKMLELKALLLSAIDDNGELSEAERGNLLGECDLIMSFLSYNDISAMSRLHRSASAQMSRIAISIHKSGGWTFGSPSVLMMFHRAPGKMQSELADMDECMPHYYKITDGHGQGAEKIMRAEAAFAQGRFTDAHIELESAYARIEGNGQENMALCCDFLAWRLSLCTDVEMRYSFEQRREQLLRQHNAAWLNILDAASAYYHALLGKTERIPEVFSAHRLSLISILAPGKPMAEMIENQVLLAQGAYAKVIGRSEGQLAVCEAMHYALVALHIRIQTAAAYEALGKRAEACRLLDQALKDAAPDWIMIPFVENYAYIKPTLQYCSGQPELIGSIVRLGEAMLARKKAAPDAGSRPAEFAALTDREYEIASLTLRRLSNREIAEKLFLSEGSVKQYMKQIYSKLGIQGDTRTKRKQLSELMQQNF